MSQPRPVPASAESTRRRGGLRRSAILPAVALLLPLSILVFSSWIGWQVAEREASREINRTAAAGSEYVGRVLSGYRFALSRVVDLVRDLPDAEIVAQEAHLHSELQRIIRELPQAEAAYVTDRHGFPLLGASVYPVPRDVATAADRSFFLSLSSPNPPALHVSEVYRSRLDGIAFFALSRRREGGDSSPPPGNFSGVVNVSVFPELIGASLRHFLSSPDDAMALVMLDGRIIVRTSTPSSGLPTTTRDVPDDFEQSMELDTISLTDGQRQMVARRRVAGFPLFVAVRRLRSAVVSDWRRDQVGQWAFGLPVTLALFLLSLRVTRDSEKLAVANAGLGVALTETEARLTRTTEAAGIGTWEYDPVSLTLTGSPQWYRLWGFDPEKGSPSRDAMLARLAPQYRAPMLAMLSATQATGRGQLEYAVHRALGEQASEIAWRVTEAHRVRRTNGLRDETLVGVTYDITKRRVAEDRAASLLHRAVDEREAERLRIARDLHDGLGQHLALLHLELAALAGDGDLKAGLVRLEAIAMDLGKEVNRLAHDIRPTAIDDVGFGMALRQMADQWSERTGQETDLILHLPVKRMPLSVETALYRIVQEALTNVLKHAQATRVGIVIGFDQNCLKMVIEDDGRGMDTMDAPQGSTSLGLRGIAERLELLGGTLEIESSTESGTVLLIEVPL